MDPDPIVRAIQSYLPPDKMITVISRPSCENWREGLFRKYSNDVYLFNEITSVWQWLEKLLIDSASENSPMQIELPFFSSVVLRNERNIISLIKYLKDQWEEQCVFTLGVTQCVNEGSYRRTGTIIIQTTQIIRS